MLAFSAQHCRTLEEVVERALHEDVGIKIVSP